MRQIARAIIIKNNQLLVIKRNNNGDEYYVVPGGGIDPGETAEAAAIREVMEETSINVSIDRLIYTWQDEEYGAQQCFLCTYINGEPMVQEGSNEAEDNKLGLNTFEAMWLDISEIQNITLYPPNLKAALLQDIDSGLPTQPKAI